MTTLSVTLPKNLIDHIQGAIKRGVSDDTSAYVEKLVLDDRKRYLEGRLEALLLEGLASDHTVPLTPHFMDDLFARALSEMNTRPLRRPSIE